MKSKILRICLMSVLAAGWFPAKSQLILGLLFGDKLNSKSLTFGLHIDYTWNTISGLDRQDAYRPLNLGLFFTYHFNEKWHLNIEMMPKIKKGADGLPVYPVGNDTLDAQLSGGEIKRRINYIGMQSTIQYMHKWRVFLEAGPVFLLRTGATDNLEHDINDNTLVYERDIRDQVNNWYIGWIGGIGYRIKGAKRISVGARFEQGFNSVNSEGSGKFLHTRWGFYCNLPIGGHNSKEAK